MTFPSSGRALSKAARTSAPGTSLLRPSPRRVAKALAALAALLTASAAQPREGSHGARGVVVSDDSRSSLAEARVWINGHTIRTDRRGLYKWNGDLGRVIEVRINRRGYYPARHVFSVTELPSAHGRLLLPSIPLVRRIAGRTLLVLGGDVMLGRRFESPAFGEQPVVRAGHRLEDIKRLLAPIRWELSNGDYTGVNLETVVSRGPKEAPPPKSVTFYSPPELVEALKWAGVDYVTLGNNHSYDYLQGGISDTLAVLDKEGMAWSGAGRDEHEALGAHQITLSGTTYAWRGFVGWKGNVTPHQAAEGSKGGAALASAQTILAALDADRQNGGTSILQFHDGTEYADEPTDRVRQNIDLALAHGAALVVGHHPHVTQGFVVKDDRLVAYSIGNLLFDQDFYETQATMLLKVWMDRGHFHRAEIVPLHIRNYRPVPAMGSMRFALLQRLKILSAANGTEIQEVAGHGVIWPGTAVRKAWPAPALLDRRPQDAGTGHDLWLRGDFESVFAGAEPERSWQIENGRQELQWTGPASGYALSVQADHTNQPLIVVQKTFMRTYSSGALSLALAINPGCRANLVAEVQFRGERRPGETTAPESAWITAETRAIDARHWSTLSFALPRTSDVGKGFRVRLKREALAPCDKPMLLDDIRLLQRRFGQLSH